MKSTINLRHIEAFRAVMLSGSVVGAAELLSVTQPGVSRTIGLFELRLGYPLFHRKGRRLVPTAEAEALYREVEQIYGGIERITEVAQDLRHHRAGALKVAVLPALAQWLVPEVIAKFMAERPQATVFVQSLPSRQIAELVSTRQFEVGVIELPLARAGVSVTPLPSGDMVAVLPARHRLVDQSEIALAELISERLILPSQHSYVRYQIDDAFNQRGLAAQVVAETPTSSIACALAAAGAGIALVSHWVPAPISDPRCVVRPLKECIRSQYGVVTPSNHPPMVLANEFAELLALRMAQ
ncbi:MULTISPECIES: LysR substrate-binding domain-containing protein [unclassified Brenneria]|uniref:LysR substrate-binding domain-containing protein n=1 Tax=unclassified Brenneria TaxID=2634434 RepID=UPI0018F0FE31|nr:LysR substrate-binding domain-containing protein [Brenneria sp. L3-3C-1]MBJ7223534.1 LysR family transcriptional regulator [Brenneria sp. L3-3C-1]MEE3644775.1 LysR substrate-binding domain-containing protein [Brenneria sp. L3_3C_1]